MIQLDNITKGKEMLGQPNGQPLSEQQKAELNGHVEKLPIIMELKDNDIKIMDKLGSLEIGQTEIEERLDEGAGQFKELWSEVNEMKNSINNLKDEFQKGIKEVITEVKDQKFTELKDELTNRKEKEGELKNFFIKTTVLTIISVLGYLFIKAYG